MKEHGCIFLLLISRGGRYFEYLGWFSGKILWGFGGMIVENNLSAIRKYAK